MRVRHKSVNLSASPLQTGGQEHENLLKYKEPLQGCCPSLYIMQTICDSYRCFMYSWDSSFLALFSILRNCFSKLYFCPTFSFQRREKRKEKQDIHHNNQMKRITSLVLFFTVFCCSACSEASVERAGTGSAAAAAATAEEEARSLFRTTVFCW